MLTSFASTWLRHFENEPAAVEKIASFIAQLRQFVSPSRQLVVINVAASCDKIANEPTQPFAVGVRRDAGDKARARLTSAL